MNFGGVDCCKFLVTNQEVIENIRPEMSLEGRITKIKLTYFGHIMRRNESLEKDIMLGKVEGKRSRGRPPLRWIDTVKNDMTSNISVISILTSNRIEYRKEVHKIAMSRKRLDGT